MTQEEQWKAAYVLRTDQFKAAWAAQSSKTQANYNTALNTYFDNLEADEEAIFGGDPHGHPRPPH